MTIIVIQPDGTVSTREHTGYDALNDTVGGYIEAIFLRNGTERMAVMYCNEDGKRLNLPVNSSATQLAHDYAGLAGFDFVVGAVAIVGSPDIEGEDTDPPEWIRKLVL